MNRIGIVEWIIVAFILAVSLSLGLAPFLVSQSFIDMFNDFGSLSELPRLTQIVLSKWYGILGALMPVVLLAFGFVFRRRVALRRVLFTSAFFIGLVTLGGYLFGLYSPIFEIADVVGP